jgi:hypothetical protein
MMSVLWIALQERVPVCAVKRGIKASEVSQSRGENVLQIEIVFHCLNSSVDFPVYIYKHKLGPDVEALYPGFESW